MYESWFQLAQRPFASPPRLADYFPAQAIETALDTMKRCVERGAGPAVVVGGAGTGKTVLCLKLLDHFRPLASVIHLSAVGLRTRRELLQTILFELGRPYDAADEGELRLSLIDFLTSRDATRHPAVLVVDDADELPSDLFEEVGFVSNLVRDGKWCVDLVLVGKTKLEEHLALPRMESLNQRIAARCYLHPWGHAETTEYITFQMSRARGDAKRVFAPGAIDQVFHTTGGVPRLVNQLCDHVLLLAALGQKRSLDPRGILEAWSDLQQLPAPNLATQPGQRASDQRSIIEFGTLADDSPPSTMRDQRQASILVSSEAASPEARLEAIEAELQRAGYDFECEQDCVIAAVPDSNHTGVCQNPFAERFDDEEIVVDRAGPKHHPALPRHAPSPDNRMTLGEALQLIGGAGDPATRGESIATDVCYPAEAFCQITETMLANDPVVIDVGQQMDGAHQTEQNNRADWPADRAKPLQRPFARLFTSLRHPATGFETMKPQDAAPNPARILSDDLDR